MFAFLRRVSHHLSSCQTTRGPYIRYFYIYISNRPYVDIKSQII
nr:MAG TPA: hypothetical protein [Caudoviricetes sp.]